MSIANKPFFIYDTKLAPPPLKQYFPRPRLVHRLAESLDHTLTLLCAPAGAGKTTLLAEFAAKTAARVAWLRLDRGDNDPSIFTNCMLLALATRAGHHKASGSASPEAWRIEVALPRLVQALSRAAEAVAGQLVVVLDDYHKVGTSGAIDELVTGLLEFAPPGVHLIASSRSLPALPLARLRLSGQSLELTQDDLALDADEVAAFLARSCELQLAKDEVRLVLARTGGWIAGVSMLGQLLKDPNKGGVISSLREFSGGSGVVYDYFAEEVLHQQSPSVQRFLMHTSLLDELHRDLVNPLLGTTHGQRILESLAANNVFLVALDASRDWYRYHPLFHGFLRARAERSFGRQTLKRLHERAATAYASRENWGRAIDHLCAAGSFEAAASIIERVGHGYIERGHLETVTHWLGSLPDALKQDRPRLLVIEGRVAERQGSYRRAAEVLTRAHGLMAGRGDNEGLLRVAIDRGLVSNRLGKHREAADLLERALDSDPDDQTRVDVLGTLCLSYRDLGELDRSARCGGTALEALAGVGGPEFRPGLESRTLRVLAQTYLDQGHPDRALALVLRARELCLREQLGELELGWVLCTLGLIRAARGEAELALRAFREAEAQTASYVPLQRYRVNLWRCHVYTDLGDFASAEACNQLTGLPAAERSWLHFRQGQMARAISIATEGLDRLAGGEPPPQRASLLGALGLALAGGSRMAEAFECLRDAADLLATRGYVHRLASLHLHVARLRIETGQAEAGNLLLRRALATAERRGIYHFSWWDPELLARPLAFALDCDELRPYIRRLVERHEAEADQRALAGLTSPCHGPGDGPTEPDDHGGTPLTLRAAAVLASCPDPVTRARIEQTLASDQTACNCVVRLHDDFGLTWREIEVFLAYYLERRPSLSESNRAPRGQVAERLCVTENTLKSHLKNIRRKLGLPPGADSLQAYRLVLA